MTETWVRQGLPPVLSFYSTLIDRVAQKVDVVVRQARAVTDPSILTPPFYNTFLSRELCSGVLVGLPHFCGFWRLFRPTFAEDDIFITVVNNSHLFDLH